MMLLSGSQASNAAIVIEHDDETWVMDAQPNFTDQMPGIQVTPIDQWLK